jgi:transposase
LKEIHLTDTAQERYETIKILVEQNGNKLKAAKKLNCTRRSIDRYINGYKTKGKAFFVHGNRGRKPKRAISDEVKRMIVDLYKTKYCDATYQHYSELLGKHESISVSETVVRKLLMGEYILSPQATKAKKKAVRQELKEMEQTAKTEKEIQKVRARILDIENAHPRRPRCANFGEVQQMDASLHPWFGGRKTTLHIAVDDASGLITGAWFAEQETLDGYYHVFQQILSDFGIPYKFLTDRRTVFEYRKKGKALDENDTLTQFAYACKRFGVDIETTSVAQAKGRVERMFETLQGRLPVEMRLAGIHSIDEANGFLNQYIPEFNQKFGLNPTFMPSVFEESPSEKQINQTLAVLTRRSVDRGHSIRFANKYYRTVSETGHSVYFYQGTKGLVVRTFDGQLFFSLDNALFALEEIPEHERTSKNFDFRESAAKPSKKYIPPMTHPWKRASFEAFQRKQAHQATQTMG